MADRIRYHDPKAEEIARRIDAINEDLESHPISVKAKELALSGYEGLMSKEEFQLLIDQRELTLDTAGNRRDLIWESQLEHSISGIEWISVAYGGIEIEVPRIAEQLKVIPSDKQVLVQSKTTALEFLKHWGQVFSI